MVELHNVDAVLGADWSRVALFASDYLGPLDVPLLTGGATSSRLDRQPAVFRTVYSDSDVQPLLALAGAKLGSTVGLLASEDDFGLGGLETLRTAFANQGVIVVAEETFLSTDPTGVPVGDGCRGHPERLRIVERAVAALLKSGAGILAVSATDPSTQCAFAAAAGLSAAGLLPEPPAWLSTEVMRTNWSSDWGRQVPSPPPPSPSRAPGKHPASGLLLPPPHLQPHRRPSRHGAGVGGRARLAQLPGRPAAAVGPSQQLPPNLCPCA